MMWQLVIGLKISYSTGTYSTCFLFVKLDKTALYWNNYTNDTFKPILIENYNLINVIKSNEHGLKVFLNTIIVVIF